MRLSELLKKGLDGLAQEQRTLNQAELVIRGGKPGEQKDFLQLQIDGLSKQIELHPKSGAINGAVVNSLQERLNELQSKLDSINE
jgi:hypothetical protein